MNLSEETNRAQEGLMFLLDEIADQAHDRYGIDCLLAEDPPVEDLGRGKGLE